MIYKCLEQSSRDDPEFHTCIFIFPFVTYVHAFHVLFDTKFTYFYNGKQNDSTSRYELSF